MAMSLRSLTLGIPTDYFGRQLLIALVTSVAVFGQFIATNPDFIIDMLGFVVVDIVLYPFAVFLYQNLTNTRYGGGSLIGKVFGLWLCLSFAVLLGPISIVNQLMKNDTWRRGGGREF